MASKELPKSSSATSAVDISLIIVSYNTAGLLRRCLVSVQDSLALSPGLTHEIWVIDNGSSDGSADMVDREFPRVKLIANDVNLGFAAANNQALTQTNSRFVMLLNPDTEVKKNAIATMLHFLQDHERVGIVGCRLVHSDGSFQHSCFRFPNLWMTLLDYFPINHRLTNSRLNGRYPLTAYSRPFAIDHPLGACMLIRSEVLRQIGPLDEQFFIYCEEIDLCLRAKRAGWEIYCVPEAEVVHHVAQSTRQFRGPMLVELHRSRYALFAKHYGRVFRWLNRGLVRAGMAHEASRTRRELSRGLLTPEEADERLRAYEQIAKMPEVMPPSQQDARQERIVHSRDRQHQDYQPQPVAQEPLPASPQPMSHELTSSSAQPVGQGRVSCRASSDHDLNPIGQPCPSVSLGSRVPVAAAIITRNEEGHIEECLRSLSWTDEIVVVDSYSTDSTVELCRKHTDRVYQRHFENFSKQRNHALDLVSCPWVLFVDADERVTPSLAYEIREAIDRDTSSPTDESKAGYWIPRQNFILGKWMRHTGWYPDYQLRLLRVQKARYDERREVHEVAELQGQTDHLKEALIHYNYDTLAQFCTKQAAYATYEARLMLSQGIRPRWRNYLGAPAREFQYRYLRLHGYRDGAHGLLLSTLLAWYKLDAYVKLRQLSNNQDLINEKS